VVLIYSVIASLDGYTVDADGNFDWAAPDEQVHAFVNALERPVGTYLYGRRMYETMRGWQDLPAEGTDPSADFARIWQAADKIVYSTTLARSSTPRTTIERRFDPAAVRALKATHDITVGGPTLAAHALRAGLVDECHLLLQPIAVGGGTRALPAGLRLNLELRETRRFDSGVVYLRYAVRP